MSTSSTAYSPDSSPKTKDWAKPVSHQGKYGTGPGLQDPDDAIQNSDEAYEDHLEKATKAVGPGPSMRRPSDMPDVEHREHFQSPRPRENRLRHSSTARTDGSGKTAAELERENTISTFRTKIGLEPEAPILDGHEIHHHLTWSAVRTMFREPFAEFFGTFIMVCFGDASVAQVLLSAGEKSAPGMNGFGNYQSINWG